MSKNPDAGKQRHNSGAKKFGKPFQPGVSGNPSGRPRGSVSPTAVLRRCFTKADAAAIARKIVSLAKKGNDRCIKLLFERLDPEPIAISLAGGHVIKLETKTTTPIDYASLEKCAREVFGISGPDGGPIATKEENPLAGLPVERLRQLAKGQIHVSQETNGRPPSETRAGVNGE